MLYLIYTLTENLTKTGGFKVLCENNVNMMRFFLEKGTLEILIPVSVTGGDGLWIPNSTDPLWQRIAVLLYQSLKKNQRVEVDRI